MSERAIVRSLQVYDRDEKMYFAYGAKESVMRIKVINEGNFQEKCV